MSEIETTNLIDSLWLTFKLKEQVFAVDAASIHSIFLTPDNIEPIPQYPDTVRGVLSLRGQITPMMDLRSYFHLPTVADEYANFKDMLEMRKQDHIRWVEALRVSVEENVPFTLATDPHKCAFGKWYDQFHSPSSLVTFHMAKINEPHQQLHGMAEKALSCKRDCVNCQREECLRTSLDRATSLYMPRVVSLLEEAKEVFRSHYHEMCVVLSDGERQLGLIVDEVISVAPLESVGDMSVLDSFPRSEIVTGVARCEEVPGEILTLDSSAFFAMLQPC